MESLKGKFINKDIESLLKTALLFLVIYICFEIFRPFLVPVVWGIIIAVALYPLHLKLKKLFKGNDKMSTTVITLLVLALIVVPSVLFAGGLISGLKELSTQLEEGTLVIPPPNESVKDWPVVGESVAETWKMFSTNVESGIEHFAPQIKKVGGWLLAAISDLVKGFFMFIIAVIIAGVLLFNSDKCFDVANKVFSKLAGARGPELVKNAKLTISSVVNGVLGTALLQSIVISIGFFLADVPGAAILSLLVLICAIVQLPLIVIILPVTIYVFPELPTWGGVLFAVWMIFGSISDNFFKPMLLGRGMDIPMLIILIGSIGGMVAMGIIGLFIGAVCLAMGYQLFNLWVFTEQEENA